MSYCLGKRTEGVIHAAEESIKLWHPPPCMTKTKKARKIFTCFKAHTHFLTLPLRSSNSSNSVNIVLFVIWKCYVHH